MTVNTSLPIDTGTMRATAHRLLADDAEPPTPEQLETLTLQLRGHIDLLMPEVETAALRLPRYYPPRDSALTSVWVARRQLSAGPPPGAVEHRELAYCLSALCDRYEELSGSPAGRGGP
ncbi:hypothetical protein SSP24_75830 [Streptomyces spinoverrucosus]|uniref:Uncharacterized protein n=1 Tax=Streptomyces spinoverrucosus TaxID=284043 RepID=A0A4Y3VUL0_9ACTN|nr:DUF6415 family natural product biosynthesis protein [Streptomyces spinoverrucosus]GEC09928.1 hypothetical protein SSP24_75830 [Streptomyces spinoverrucosus]GHB66762.1 hypothetical protein GCM10010397_41270 [Streptomyces spinoverrucosus]